MKRTKKAILKRIRYLPITMKENEAKIIVVLENMAWASTCRDVKAFQEQDKELYKLQQIQRKLTK